MGRIKTFGVAGLGLALVGSMFWLRHEPTYTPTVATPEQLAESRAYLDEYEVALPDWSQGTVDADGVTIAYGATGNTEVDRTVIFVPGIRGQAEFFSAFVHHWYDQGYRVFVVDLPGQGRSERRADNPEKMFTGDFSRLGKILAASLEELPINDASDVTLVGDSYGGHGVLRAAADHTLPVDRIVVMVPALNLPLDGATRTFVHVATTFGAGKKYAQAQGNWTYAAYDPDDDTWCANREDRIKLQRSHFALSPELRVGGITLGWVSGLLKSGADLATSAEYALPLTVIVAENDIIVQNDRAQQLCDNQGSSCTFHMLKDAQHCLVLEPDEKVDEFLALIDQAIMRENP